MNKITEKSRSISSNDTVSGIESIVGNPLFCLKISTSRNLIMDNFLILNNNVLMLFNRQFIQVIHDSRHIHLTSCMLFVQINLFHFLFHAGVWWFSFQVWISILPIYHYIRSRLLCSRRWLAQQR